MKNRITIGSRKSALARLQAYHVAAAFKRRNTDLSIEFFFKESTGDQDQKTPLWQMPDKGVFTRDLTSDLLESKVDLVIHSHKDLETEPGKGTSIVSVLPRADPRDLVLFKSEFLKQQHPETLKIYTSSPRRKYNLKNFLKLALPKPLRPTKLEFEVIRGNIQTRLQKFMEQDGEAFVIAKAALDRIMAEDFPEASDPDFIEIRSQISKILKQCHIMVLPLSWNPCAPAQGAFAMEYREDDAAMEELAYQISHRMTEIAVLAERKILAAYGGGCHQKIGAAYLPLGMSHVTFVRGQTDAGEILDEARSNSNADSQTHEASKWPPADWQMPELESMFWEVCKDNSILDVAGSQVIFTSDPGKSGLRKFDQKTTTGHNVLCTVDVADWFSWADQGVWIAATIDALGWPHAPDVSLLI